MAEGTTDTVTEAPIATVQEAPAPETPQETVKEAVTESATAEMVTQAPAMDAPETTAADETAQTQPPAQDTTPAPDTVQPTVVETQSAAPDTAPPTETTTDTLPPTATVTTADPTATATEPAATGLVLPEWKAEQVAALFDESNTLVCSDETMLASDHPYLAGVRLWSYTVQGAISIDITFDGDTFVADGDKIAILEGGDLYTLYAADDLAGRTVTIYSDTVRIALLAASGIEAYGFAVKTVKPNVPQKVEKIVPVSFSATLITAQSVQLTWQGDGTQSGFALYRKASGQGTYTLLGTLASTATTFTDKSLPAYKNVEYRLFGLDSDGKRGSEYLAAYAYSLTATRVSVARASTGTQVRWNKVSGASGYYVLRVSTTMLPMRASARLQAVLRSALPIPLRIATARSPTVCRHTAPYQAPLFPGLSAGFIPCGLTLTTRCADGCDGLGLRKHPVQKSQRRDRYLIYRKNQGGSYARIATTTATAYTDRVITDGGVYTYLVRPYGVVSGKLVSIASGESIGYTAKTVTLNVGRVNSSGMDNADITWSAVPNAARYRLMRYCSDGSESEVRIVIPGDTLTYTDTGLDVNKEYYYTLRPYADIGGGQYLGGPTSNRVYCKPIITYRALLIGQMYTGTSYALHGTENDRDAIAAALYTMGATPYTVTQKTDLTGSGILSAIQTAFSGATDNDVSLFFYSGHGVQSTDTEYLGALCGVDLPSASAYITPTKLRNALDTIPGTKIVIIDACHSGNMIGKNLSATGDASIASTAVDTVDDQAMNQMIASSFISAFATAAKANLATGGYYVLVAAHSSQTSIEMFNGYKWFGYFTTILCQGSGYDEINDSVLSSLYADANRDLMISLSEAYNYVIANTGTVEQVAQVYPTGSSYVLYGR